MSDRGPPSPRASAEATKPPMPRRTSKPPRELPVLGTFAGFDILGRLALGGMAEILLARHIDMDDQRRYLVVKRILAHYETDNEFVQMFLDEARIGMQLDHPNIISFFQFGDDAGSHFITMEWINGMPLGRVIRRARKLGGISQPLAMYIAACVAKALHHAHTARDEHGEKMRLIHRDVSPHNIMISYDGEVKLLDFGIAKADTQAHKTQAGVVKGKFAYMSPEQCVGGAVDHRLDVFALGVVLFETITGKSLYRRDTEAATMRSIIMDPVPSLKDKIPDIPEPLDTIARKALAKEPDDRFSTAEQFANALEEYMRMSQQIVGQADLAGLMREAFKREYRRGPQVDSVPFGSSYNADNDASFALSGMDTGGTGGNGGASIRAARGTRELELELDSSDGGLDALLDVPRAPARAAAPRQPPTASPGRRVSKARTTPSILGPLKFLAALLAMSIGLYMAWTKYTKVATEEKEAIEELEYRDTGSGPNPLLEQQGTSIVASSVPAGARVYVDGEEKGITPKTLSGLLPGRYSFQLRMPGFVAWEGDIDVEQGKATYVDAKLSGKQGGAPAGAFGFLNVDTEPPVAVYLGSDFLGRTPLRKIPVPSGYITLTFKRGSKRDVRQKVFVVVNKVVDVERDF